LICTHCIQKAAARLIFQLHHFDHITYALVSLHWLRVPERIVFKVTMQTYKAQQQQGAPPAAGTACWCNAVPRAPLTSCLDRSLVLYHRWSVCSCHQTFNCWTSCLSCYWCMYMQRFIFRYYLLTQAHRFCLHLSNNEKCTYSITPTPVLAFNCSTHCGP